MLDLYLIKWTPTQVFSPWNLRNFSEHFLWKTPANDCSWISVAHCQNTFLPFLTWSVLNFILLLRDLPISMTGTLFLFLQAIATAATATTTTTKKNWNSLMSISLKHFEQFSYRRILTGTSDKKQKHCFDKLWDLQIALTVAEIIVFFYLVYSLLKIFFQ